MGLYGTQENAWEQESVKDFVVTEKRLWDLRRLLNNRTGSFSITSKKNTKGNNKVYDVNQRTEAALDRLTEVYETFEDTWDTVVKESAAGDLFFASEEVDKLEVTRQHQDHTLEVQEDCRKSMDRVYKEFSNCRALHEVAWFDVKETGRRHSELMRKAEEAHTRTFLQREDIRRTTHDHVKAEEVLNNGVGCLGTLVKDTGRPVTRIRVASLTEKATKQSTCARPQT